jgi:hypothetical protein
VANPLCSSCHRLMDPIGFGLESFDALGRHRTHETILIEGSAGKRNSTKKVDLDLDTKGEIAGIEDSSFSNAKQLGGILSQSKVCQECVVRQMFRYAYGRMESSADEETIQQLYAAFRGSGFHLKELLLGLVKAPQFMAGLEDNRSGGTPLASPGVGATTMQAGRVSGGK